jgi:hypothetical protein
MFGILLNTNIEQRDFKISDYGLLDYVNNSKTIKNSRGFKFLNRELNSTNYIINKISKLDVIFGNKTNYRLVW